MLHSRLGVRRATVLAAAASMMLVTGAASAQAPSVDLSRFRPSSGADGLLSVEGARPLADGDERLQLKLLFDGAVRPLVFEPETGGTQTLVSSRVGGTFAANVHVWGPLSFAAQLPLTFSHRGDLSSLPPSARGPAAIPVGLGDIRLTPRAALLRQESSGLFDLGAQASLDLPTARGSSLTGSGRVSGELLLAAARRFGFSSAQVEALGNVFTRLRPPRDLLDAKMGNELGLRAGAALLLGRAERWFPRRVFGELEAATSLRELSANSSPSEWRVGATFCATNALAIEGGGGGAIGHGVGAPAARFLLGVSWSPSGCAPPAQAVVAEPVPPPPEPKIEPEPAPPPPAPKIEEPAPKPRDALPPLPDLPELAAKEPQVTLDEEDDEIEFDQPVIFRLGQSAIDPQSAHLLDAIAVVIKDHPELLLLEVEGHTDTIGKPAFNRRLSQQRAEAVVKALVERGIEPARLRARGFGASTPLVPNVNEKNREKNRRVQIKVVERAGKRASG